MVTTRVAVALMKVAQVLEPGGDFEIVERDIPRPGAGQVRITVQACGICHSDVLTMVGLWPGIQYPRLPGHEVAGIIDELGEAVSEWNKGQRVSVGWHGVHDGCLRISRIAFVISMLLASFPLLAQARGRDHRVEHRTFYRAVQIDGLSIFYREAGPKDAPTLLLLHGFPSSSRMFDPLFARLSDRYHLVAPDYPGFGHSDWPDTKTFAYTFDHIAEIMDHFTEALGLSHYTLYMQDYGGPVGLRMALAHPERVVALIVQDAVAHNEGLGAIWMPRRAFWADRAGNESTFRANFLSLATTRTRHIGDDPNLDRYDPDLWTDELAFLNQPGQADTQTDLFYDYRTNVEAYPKWQAWMREKQPRLLVIWGKHDPSFDLSEPERYRNDVPNAEVHLLDAGHFALDTQADEIAVIVDRFMKTQRQAHSSKWGGGESNPRLSNESTER